MPKLKAVIVDDELFNIQFLNQMVQDYIPSVEILEEISDPLDALERLPLLKPDIVFLDIEMPGMNGFELLTALKPIDFGIIFTTKFEHYAIRAIRFAAIDYLLKPIDLTALQEAVSRAKERTNFYNTPSSSDNPQVNPSAMDVFAVTTNEGIVFVKTCDINYCESNDRYVKIYMDDNREFMVTRTLSDFESLLSGSGFVRIHKSYLVNILHVRKYYRAENRVQLSNDVLLEVSRTGKTKLMKQVAWL